MSLTVKQARELAAELLAAVGLDREDAESTQAGGYPPEARLDTIPTAARAYLYPGGRSRTLRRPS